jgi:hypothetical protein
MQNPKECDAYALGEIVMGISNEFTKMQVFLDVGESTALSIQLILLNNAAAFIFFRPKNLQRSTRLQGQHQRHQVDS